MRLKKIELENFRCYERLSLDLHPRLTVLVGKNGAGKTAILDALAIALSPVLRYLSSANQRLSGVGFKDTDIRVEPWCNQCVQQRWGACDFSHIKVETTSALSWDVWKGSAKGKSPASKVGETELAREMAKLSESFKSQSPEILPVFAYYGAQRGYIEIPQRLRPSNHNYAHPPSALLDALDARSDFRGMLQWFDLEESAELRENKGARPEEFNESIALSSVRTAIEQVLGGDYSNPHFNREHKFVVEAREGPSPLQVSQLSQGYQSMLALAMDFARRLATGNAHLDHLLNPASDESNLAATSIFDELRELNPQWFGESSFDHDTPSFEALPLLSPGIMLIDEIDLHLHPSWQQRVLNDLLRAFPMTQFIVTTHSPQVLSTVRRENIRILSDNGSSQPLGRTYGEPSGDVMHSVMDVDPQPPVAERKDLQRLTELVDQGMYDEPEAKELTQRLTAALGEQHPQLQRLQRSIKRQKALQG